MKTLTIDVPEETDELEVKMAVAAILFDRGIITSGQAASFIGISKRQFIERVGKYGISVFNETTDDLRSGI